MCTCAQSVGAITHHSVVLQVSSTSLFETVFLVVLSLSTGLGLKGEGDGKQGGYGLQTTLQNACHLSILPEMLSTSASPSEEPLMRHPGLE